MNNKVKIGTRGSKLALWQAHHVADLLKKGGMDPEIITIETTGDKIQNQSFTAIGSKGLFTQELEEKLLSADIDIAVHSAKDLQSDLAEGLDILAFMEREKAQDVIVSYDSTFKIEKAGDKMVVGTSSTRRRATLRHLYPNIQLVEARGNLQTRMKKMEEGQCDAMLLAYAGVHRMEYDKYIVQELSLDIFTPAVGQGSIAIESSSSVPEEKRKQLRTLLNHEATEYCLLAERAFLKKLQGGCSIPAFAYAQLVKDKITIQGGIISLDGKEEIRKTLTNNKAQAELLGLNLAEDILQNGGEKILNEIKNTLKK